MILISKSKLKAKMLEYFRQIEKTGQEIVVTDRDKPVAKIVPLSPKMNRDLLFADLQGKLKIKGDLLAAETDEWDES